MKKILVGIGLLAVISSTLSIGATAMFSKKVSAGGFGVPLYSMSPPSGQFDVANCSILGGWNADLDFPALRPPVHIYDGTNPVPIAVLTPLVDRSVDFLISNVPQFVPTFAPYNLGFNIATPASVLDDKAHSISVYAQDINNDGSDSINGFMQLNSSPKSLGPCKVKCANGTFVDTIAQCPTISCTDASGIISTHQVPFTCPKNAPVGSVTGDCSTISGWAGDIDSVGTGLAVWASGTNFANLLQFTSDSSPNPTPLAPAQYTGSHGFSMATLPDWLDASPHTITIRYLGVNSAGTPDNTNANTTITIGPCKRAPSLVMGSSSCDAIVFTSTDPDSPASQITFLVGRSPTVVLGGPDYVTTGVTINGTGTWTIPATEKNASPHSYYILVAGLDSSGTGDTVNTTSPVVNIDVCNPAPPPPAAISGCTSASANNRTPGATVDDGSCTYDPAVVVPLPPSATRPSTPFNDIFSSTCKNQDPANPTEVSATVCVTRTVSQTNACNDIFGRCGIIAKLVNALSIIIGIASVVMVIAGGFKFVASAGDPQQAASARRIVLFASIGVVIAITAQGIILFVVNRL